MKTSKLFFVVALVVSALFGYFFGVNKVAFEWKNYHPQIHVANKLPPQATAQNVDFSLFWTVWDKLQTTYYDKKVIDSGKLLNGAISGMVQSLGDPYTVFLPPTQNTDFKQGMAGQFSGIGAELGMQGKQIIVVAPLDGSPAEKAGIKTGDAIVKVDSQATSGWSLSQAVEKIRGPKGSKVTISVLHKDDQNPKDIAITRDTITVKSVSSWVKKVKDIDTVKIPNTVDASVAYIRLSQFGDNTNQEWLVIVNKLAMQINQDKNVKGVVFDLRNNPGGYLTDAAFIASEFLKDGVIVKEDNGTGLENSLSVNRKGLLTDVSVVVLINKGSASAAEIVSGALRDHNRAKLVGETSFGKGTVQQAEDLGNGAGLHVTVAKWLTPNGTWVHGVGLKPDVEVTQSEKEPTHDLQLEKAIQELLK